MIKDRTLTEITLLDNDSVLRDDKDFAKTMNNIFIDITKNLNLKPCKEYLKF